MTNLPAVRVDVLTELGATFHPTPNTPPDTRHGDIRLPNGWGLSVAHSPRHYCGADTVEVAVIYDDGTGTWPLDSDSTIPAELGGNNGAVMGWANADTVATMLRRLAALPPAVVPNTAPMEYTHDDPEGYGVLIFRWSGESTTIDIGRPDYTEGDDERPYLFDRCISVWDHATGKLAIPRTYAAFRARIDEWLTDTAAANDGE